MIENSGIVVEKAQLVAIFERRKGGADPVDCEGNTRIKIREKETSIPIVERGLPVGQLLTVEFQVDVTNSRTSQNHLRKTERMSPSFLPIGHQEFKTGSQKISVPLLTLDVYRLVI